MPEPLGPLRYHEQRRDELSAEADALSQTADRISAARLVTFVGGAVASFAALRTSTPLGFAVLATSIGLFAFTVIWHARVLAREAETRCRCAVHERHILRLTGRSRELAAEGASHIPAGHPYASDIDLVGPESLVQRIDTSHTVLGVERLTAALAAPASRERIEARQRAVEELAPMLAFREALELEGSRRPGRLDHRPLSALVGQPMLFRERPWLRPLIWIGPATTLGSWGLAQQDVIPALAVVGLVALQGLLLWQLRDTTHRTLNVVTARLGFAEAYRGMLQLLEQTPFTSAHLRQLQADLRAGGEPPSQSLARLSRYEAWAQLRTQGPVYIVVNLLTLWDLHCLKHIEAWIEREGPRLGAFFEALAELEVLCSLATLRHGDPSTSFPDLCEPQAGLAASELAHPLLPPGRRIANDVTLAGPGTALIVTGSNMAGKSTFLRALGLNVALALAGGPVCARELRLPRVRLRASMRIDDSLGRGASYFHAELEKLQIVTGDLDAEPPVLFLLDELLRGTNARARHIGARAVVLHLLEHGALGLIATHDIALSELEPELPGRVHNRHFTDVFEGGEMRFDYVLRDGPVRTSNALRLLSMAGIPVPEDTALA